MELNRTSVIIGIVIAIGLGAAAAWWTQPALDDDRKPAPASAASSGASGMSQKPVKLYKWQDDAGVWNYTDQPPAGRNYEEVRGTPNVTSVPTVVPEVPQSAADEAIPAPSD